MFLSIFIVSIGMVKSDRISQLTGATSYLPVAASFSISLSVGENFISITSKQKYSLGVSAKGVNKNVLDRIGLTVKDE